MNMLDDGTREEEMLLPLAVIKRNRLGIVGLLSSSYRLRTLSSHHHRHMLCAEVTIFGTRLLYLTYHSAVVDEVQSDWIFDTP